MRRIAVSCAILTLALVCCASAADAPKLEVGKWRFEVLKDLMTNRSRGVAIMRSSNGVQAALIFKCDTESPQSVYAQI